MSGPYISEFSKKVPVRYRPNAASGGQSLIRRSQGGVADVDGALQLNGNVNFVFPPGRVVIADGS